MSETKAIIGELYGFDNVEKKCYSWNLCDFGRKDIGFVSKENIREWYAGQDTSEGLVLLKDPAGHHIAFLCRQDAADALLAVHHNKQRSL